MNVWPHDRIRHNAQNWPANASKSETWEIGMAVKKSSREIEMGVMFLKCVKSGKCTSRTKAGNCANQLSGCEYKAAGGAVFRRIERYNRMKEEGLA